MPNENETNLNNDTVNIDENVPTESANEEMSSENVALKKSESKIRKTKKVSNKKSSVAKKKKTKKTKKNDVKKNDKKMDDKKTDKQHKKAGKITTKSSSKKKNKKIETSSSKKKSSKNIEDEIQKVTNIKSIEQIKKPQKIALMVAFYAVIVIAVLVFCLIRFSKPKNTNLLIEESINYEFLTEEVVTTSERIVEESSTDTDDIKNDSQQSSDLLLALTTKSADSYKSDTENKDESINKTESTKQIENKKTIETENTKKNVEETTKKLAEETTRKQVEEASKKKVEETTKKQVETTEKIETKAWPKRNNVNDILPRYKEVIYPYPVFSQMSLEEIGLINNAITENYNAVKDKVFGEDISFANKGTNGILYLNYTYLQQFIEAYTSNSKQSYEQLPVVPYYNYIMNDKFNFNYKTYTTNLNMKLDFKNAKNQGQYFEVPATIYEPTGSSVSSNGINKINVRVLKKAKVGYTESFSLTSLLEVLDIECHTKHNPFFDIEDLIGTNPKAITDMRESGFDVRNMIDEEIFNYVMFDKKGYITALYMLKS